MNIFLAPFSTFFWASVCGRPLQSTHYCLVLQPSTISVCFLHNSLCTFTKLSTSLHVLHAKIPGWLDPIFPLLVPTLPRLFFFLESYVSQLFRAGTHPMLWPPKHHECWWQDLRFTILFYNWNQTGFIATQTCKNVYSFSYILSFQAAKYGFILYIPVLAWLALPPILNLIWFHW